MYCLFTGRLAYNWGGGVGANMRGAGGGAISGRLWYVILVALEGIILIVIL